MGASLPPADLWERLPEPSRELCRTVAEIAAQRGETVYLVGGSVRDLLLGASQVDLDIVVVGDAPALATAVASRLGARASAPSEFRTGAVYLLDGHVDLATARQETYPEPAKLPVVEPAGIAEDLRRRDFTINAMALGLTAAGAAKLLDPFNGQADLQAGLIRVLHPVSFVDDPTRIVRAVRLEQRLGFALEPGTAEHLRAAVGRRGLEAVSGARRREEVVKAIAEPDPARVFARLRDLGALQQAVPGADPAAIEQGRLPLARRAVLALRPAARERDGAMWPYVLGALCATGDPERAAVGLELDSRARRVLQEMARGVSGPLPVVLRSRSDVPANALARGLDGRDPGELVAYWIRGGPAARRRLEFYVGAVRAVGADITGDDILARGVRPGPAVAVGLWAARAARLAGERRREGEIAAARQAIERWRAPGRRGRTRWMPHDDPVRRLA